MIKSLLLLIALSASATCAPSGWVNDAQALKSAAEAREVAGLGAPTPAVAVAEFEAGLGYAVQGRQILEGRPLRDAFSTQLLSDLRELEARLHVRIAELYGQQRQYDQAALSINAALAICPTFRPAILLRTRFRPCVVRWPGCIRIVRPRPLPLTPSRRPLDASVLTVDPRIPQRNRLIEGIRRNVQPHLGHGVSSRDRLLRNRRFLAPSRRLPLRSTPLRSHRPTLRPTYNRPWFPRTSPSKKWGRRRPVRRPSRGRRGR